jgi:hypothetical protein
MSLHTLSFRSTDGIVDLFATATPVIPAGSPLYIQNISNSEVFISPDAAMAHKFLIGGKTDKPEISIVELSAGDPAYVSTDRHHAVLTIEAT